MDVLKPQLLWIGKRCYRVNEIANDVYEQQQSATNEYIEDGLYRKFHFIVTQTNIFLKFKFTFDLI